jgi:hypothetical protein
MMSEAFLQNLRKFFNFGVDVVEYEDIPDDIGGHYKFEKSVTTINGIIRPIQQRTENEIISADKLTVFSTHMLYCEKEIIGEETIDETKFIRYRGKEYDVLFVQNVMNFDDMLQVNLRLIE